MTKNKSYYLQRHAMLFGTYMGGFWILKFALLPLGLTVPFLLFLFMVLTLCVPFMGYYYTRMYRNQVCGGTIRFAHAWVFSVFMYMFAALFTAVAHYFYFRFIDQGYLLNTYENILSNYTSIAPPQMEVYIDQLQDALEVMRSLTSVDITMQLMSQNVFYGMILAIPTALFVMKRKKEKKPVA